MTMMAPGRWDWGCGKDLVNTTIIRSRPQWPPCVNDPQEMEKAHRNLRSVQFKNVYLTNN